MLNTSIRNIALAEHGLSFSKKSTKKKMIHAIQRAEGYEECYKSGVADCKNINCLWLKDCLK